MNPGKRPPPTRATPARPRPEGPALLLQRHLRFGWAALLVFLTLGIVLESLHAFKVGPYLNPSHATRRLMWTLAHSHGTLLGLLNLGFALTVPHFPGAPPRLLDVASGLLRAATILLPGGFFLGGLVFHEGDPGPGVVLVPLGALALLGAAALTWHGTRPR